MAFLRFPILCALFALSVASYSGVSTAPSAPAPAADCSSLVLTMADCLSFVMAGSTTEKPEGTCCSGLKTVLKTDAECLCETFRNSAQLGVSLNMTKATSLPAACHVSAPAATNCAVSSGIGAAPALSPVAVSPGSDDAGAPAAAGFGANIGAPSPTPGHSGSSGMTVSVELLAFTSVVTIMAYALF